MKKFIAACALAVAALTASTAAIAQANNTGTVDEVRKIYRCYPGYDPVRCEVVYENSTARPASVSVAQRLAAAAKPTDGPVTQCGNGHGQSACCKIIGHLEDGSVIIECGVPLLPTAGPPVASFKTVALADSIYECRRDSDGVTRCRKLRDDGGDDFSIDNLEKFDLPEVLAVSRAAKTGVPTPVLSDASGPITQCGSGHGQTACCRIIAGDPGDTLIYIECGRQSVRR